MLITFLFNLMCAISSCEYYHEFPSDPLGSRREARALSVEYPQVQTENGVVEGYTMYTIKRRPIYAFEGVPYAETTGGANRFRLPIPKGPWPGVLDTKKPGPRCVQCNPMSSRASGSEDCLSMNIYTPNLNISRTARAIRTKSNVLMPVMVYIHGGAFYFSEASHYGPAYLLDEDVILVALNYRLGIFGFLTTRDDVLPGNLGLKDQALGLKWVYDNIQHFGGDPSLITIIGLSSGATSVHLHMMSNLSTSYFTGAISLSGTAFNPGTLMTREMTNAMNAKLGQLTSCPVRDSRQFIMCLRNVNPYILAAQLPLLYEKTPLRFIRLGAVVEEESPTAFLTARPDEIYRTGRIARVPWISTRTTHEGSFGYQMLKAFRQEFRLAKAYSEFAPTLLQYNYIAKNLSEVTNKVFEFYLGKKGFTDLTNFSVFGDMSTHREFGYGLHKSLQAHSQFAPTYAYLYGFKGRNSVSGLFRMLDKDDGIVHADDLNSIFNMSRHAPGYKTTDSEYAVVKLICNLFANFAKNRVPVYRSEDGTEYNLWEPITDPKNIRMLEINKHVRMVPEPDTKQFKFWESLGLPDAIPWIKL